MSSLCAGDEQVRRHDTPELEDMDVGQPGELLFRASGPEGARGELRRRRLELPHVRVDQVAICDLRSATGDGWLVRGRTGKGQVLLLLRVISLPRQHGSAPHFVSSFGGRACARSGE